MASPLVRKIGRAERALTPHNIAHQIDAIRAKIDEIIQGIANLNANVAAAPGSTPIIPYGAVPVGLTANSVLAGGVSNNVARIDHVHSVASAAPSGYFGTNYSIGVGAGFMRADAVLKYPDSLGVNATPITDLLTLSDDGTEGALLTASNTFSVNSLALKAPNATNTLRVGKYGNIALAGTSLADTTLLSFTKLDYAEATTCIGITASLRNTSTGGAKSYLGSVICTGNFGAVEQFAMDQTIQMQNATATGDVVCFIARCLNQSASTRTNYTSFKSLPGVSLSGTTTNFRHFWAARSGTNNVAGSTLTNHIGFDVDDMQKGTNRLGFRSTGATSGTPTTAYGFVSLLHAVGTTRRAFIGDNSFESTANDFLTSTQAKGFICKDAAGTPHFWRYTVGTDGVGALVDTGTAAPAV